MNCIFRIFKIENGFLIVEGDEHNPNGFQNRIWQAHSEERAATLLIELLKNKDSEEAKRRG